MVIGCVLKLRLSSRIKRTRSSLGVLQYLQSSGFLPLVLLSHFLEYPGISSLSDFTSLIQSPSVLK